MAPRALWVFKKTHMNEKFEFRIFCLEKFLHSSRSNFDLKLGYGVFATPPPVWIRVKLKHIAKPSPSPSSTKRG